MPCRNKVIAYIANVWTNVSYGAVDRTPESAYKLVLSSPRMGIALSDSHLTSIAAKKRQPTRFPKVTGLPLDQFGY